MVAPAVLEIAGDALVFSIPDRSGLARLRISVVRTERRKKCVLRELPSDVGRLPLRHVDDYAAKLPSEWIRHGGVFLPLERGSSFRVELTSDLMNGFISFPFAVRIGLGKICAATGEPWRDTFEREPKQNYFVVGPDPVRVDGFPTRYQVQVRQFVAEPLGEGRTVEERIADRAPVGGLQIEAAPLGEDALDEYMCDPDYYDFDVSSDQNTEVYYSRIELGAAKGVPICGGHAVDPFELADWDFARARRCFVHFLSDAEWESTTAG